LIGDRGYDSDALDAQLLKDYGIEMIARHRRGRKVATQDGRPLRRTTRRWKVERLGLIRFGGHVPKGGYDVQNAITSWRPARPAAVH
jgi:hypothetical protein